LLSPTSRGARTLAAEGVERGFDSGDVTAKVRAQQVQLTLMGGGAGAQAMWGPFGGPLWVAHDPAKNVAKLNGVAVYVAASASGGVGAVDRLPEGYGPNITGGLIERILELHHRTGPGGVARLRSRALRSATGIQQINSNTPGYLHVLAEDLALVC